MRLPVGALPQLEFVCVAVGNPAICVNGLSTDGGAVVWCLAHQRCGSTGLLLFPSATTTTTTTVVEWVRDHGLRGVFTRLTSPVNIACGPASKLAAASLAHSRVHFDKRGSLPPTREGLGYVGVHYYYQRLCIDAMLAVLEGCVHRRIIVMMRRLRLRLRPRRIIIVISNVSGGACLPTGGGALLTLSELPG